MNRVIIVIIAFMSFLSGASGNLNFNSNFNNIRDIEMTGEIPVVDYNRVKRAVSNFHFYPVNFYISIDGCKSVSEEINKEDVIGIDFCIGFNVIDDFHHLRIELFTPDEAVFQTINLFVDEPQKAPFKVRYNNDYTPYDISKVFLIGETYFIKSSIPIAGSSIQSQNLVGRWRAELYIDDSKRSYGTFWFEIK
ncbi:MAG: hypothetical protein ACP5QK_07540 [Myxococcota bacterium]